jgi:hypothetical protein
MSPLVAFLETLQPATSESQTTFSSSFENTPVGNRHSPRTRFLRRAYELAFGAAIPRHTSVATYIVSAQPTDKYDGQAAKPPDIVASSVPHGWSSLLTLTSLPDGQELSKHLQDRTARARLSHVCGRPHTHANFRQPKASS